MFDKNGRDEYAIVDMMKALMVFSELKKVNN